MKLKKPHILNKGDKVATVSLSWGGAGDELILWRYQQGKERLEQIFGLEVFDSLRGTVLFPSLKDFERAILFLETSEEKPEPWYVEMALRTYGINGILNNLRGMIIGKPQEEAFYEEYKKTIKKVLAEFHREDMPILYNLNFGHTEPKICLPYGALAEINCEEVTFSILESGVI